MTHTRARVLFSAVVQLSATRRRSEMPVCAPRDTEDTQCIVRRARARSTITIRALLFHIHIYSRDEKLK